MFATYSIGQIAEIVGARAFYGKKEVLINHHAFDTRQELPAGKVNTLFWALKGNFRDGHFFIAEAYHKGIRSFCVSQISLLSQPFFNEVNWVVVEDVLNALQQLAFFHRRCFQIPVVGITGSNGKTIVKEWLSEVLAPQKIIVKSPMSYNSQLGVPLSILQMQPHHQVAILEAGISQMGEMEKLEKLIAPTIGILTHFGDAHQEGFPSPLEKLQQKLILFQKADVLIYSKDNDWIAENVNHPKTLSIGFSPKNDICVIRHSYYKDAWHFTISLPEGTNYSFYFPLPGWASLENVLLVLAAANLLGVSWETIVSAIPTLRAVSMRTELITDNPEITILNDAYNADLASIYNAFSLLKQYKGRKVVILSDIEQLESTTSLQVHKEITYQAEQKFGAENLFLIGSRFSKLWEGVEKYKTFSSLEDFLQNFEYDFFRNTTVLLKGARKFELEKIIPYLTRSATATYFKINLNKLAANYQFFRGRIPATVGIIAMLKASAYGAGSWQIALELERLGVTYFAVAFTTEGIQLREKGIQHPILVLNPEEKTLPLLVHYFLTPAIGSFRLLQKISEVVLEHDTSLPIHLEFDTGMARLGFSFTQLNQLVFLLKSNPRIMVEAVFTHLASSDSEKDDDFTYRQLQMFTQIYATLQRSFPDIKAHCYNTAALLRLETEGMYDWVRLGIGLYGISPIPQYAPFLQEVGSLHSVISQLHYYPKGTSIGYNRTQTTQRDSIIATIPVGYADGIPRSLSNGKICCKVRNCWAPTIGKICMDMLMLDVTHVPDVQEGDEVTIFGSEALSIQEWAAAANTIPYEILTRISSRVRRIYVRE
ncbi:MAG: bifunctional UDP-N-acetylmuramoyl-tripeptide:D-alanyl-D-alanine ligase/alanine racemase [Bacteroidia bacterium]|nr:bifunctional UDP-N-acetylmuramoyl-tripeptide:D-alanyl-D-alanine ligase/alanine racemase [Bacteroidia bacterium]MDW8158394.1 bifunctional UDP-N-acetylmuramoyl-tripeptide:D-alanyl-D-alanine ligase/alanine racemase [Bacteroidia bacterium]